MIVCVSFNPALDITYRLDALTHRARKSGALVAIDTSSPTIGAVGELSAATVVEDV